MRSPFIAACLVTSALACSEPAPAPPGSGEFIIQSGALTLAPGDEAYACYFVRAPDLNGGRDYFVSGTEITTGGGSHHIMLYRVRTVVALDPARAAPFTAGPTSGTFVRGGECTRSGNRSDWPVVTGSSYGSGSAQRWTLPAGVAHRFQPGEQLMLQMHTLNLGSRPITTQARVELTRSTEPNPAELGVLVATQPGVRVCRSDSRPMIQGTCPLPSGAAHVIAAIGHSHSRGVRLRMVDWDGRAAGPPADTGRFYESLVWDEPPLVTEIDRAVAPGGGVFFSCEYRWREPSVGCDAVNRADPSGAGDCCFTDGPSMDVNEHCNAFIYYWPKLSEAPACVASPVVGSPDAGADGGTVSTCGELGQRCCDGACRGGAICTDGNCG